MAGMFLGLTSFWNGAAVIGGLLILLGLWALFVWWTYDPPQLPLFTDPVTGQTGIPPAGEL